MKSDIVYYLVYSDETGFTEIQLYLKIKLDSQMFFQSVKFSFVAKKCSNLKKIKFVYFKNKMNQELQNSLLPVFTTHRNNSMLSLFSFQPKTTSNFECPLIAEEMINF